MSGGSVLASEGDTVVWATANADRVPTGDGSFVPFQVHYQERLSASGRTPGTYNRRDGRPRDPEVLRSRLIDRPLRPMIQSGWNFDTQVSQHSFSHTYTYSCVCLCVCVCVCVCVWGWREEVAFGGVPWNDLLIIILFFI